MSMQNALTAIMEIKKPVNNYDPKLEIKRLLLGNQNLVVGAVQRLGFVHFARFVFMELGVKEYFAIITTYDFDFDDYMNVFIDDLGDLFNAMLPHIEDHGIPEETDSLGKMSVNIRHHRQPFIDYVRRVDLTHPDKILMTQKRKPQQPLHRGDTVAVFYSAYPNLSVQHITKLEREAYV
jgi:hypothetical protein